MECESGGVREWSFITLIEEQMNRIHVMMDESDYNDVYDDAADEECTSPISPNYHASE